MKRGGHYSELNRRRKYNNGKKEENMALSINQFFVYWALPLKLSMVGHFQNYLLM